MNKALSTKFGFLIRTLRVEKKLSQEDLADKSDVHRTYIGMVERGEKNVTLESISKISKGLDITMGDLFYKLDALKE